MSFREEPMMLYKQTTGNGPDLVMLHGWGLHGGIFDGVVEDLARDYRVTCIDLPGHGRSHDTVLTGNITDWVEAVLAVAPKQAAWLGWSLGSLLVQIIARTHPQRCSRLVLSNATPKFLSAPDWPPAQTPAVLDQFTAGLQNDYRATVQQFLALQVGAGLTGRKVLRALRDKVFAHGNPHPDALLAGVDILRQTDLRQTLGDIQQPVQIISGRLDRLTPPAASDYLAQQLPDARHYRFERSAHAPFLSHPAVFIEVVRQFLTE